jgi:hypothetical protein
MKLIKLNPESIQHLLDEKGNYLLDLQTVQKVGHPPFQHWVKKYSISLDQELILPDVIHACLMGKVKGIAGSQYDLNHLFHNFDLFPISQNQANDLSLESSSQSPNQYANNYPSQLISYIPKAQLKDKKVLCILSHPACGLRDLILIMPFLKIFAEALNLELSIMVNSAGISLFEGQKWLETIYPEIMDLSDFMQFDYFIEPSVYEMNSVMWIRNYLLKEFGEKVFHNRFPCPEIKISPEKIRQKKMVLDSVLKRDRNKKACLFSWESGSQRTNFSRFLWKAIVKSLMIMDHQIVVINASGAVSSIDDLIALIEYADFVIGPDSTLIHIAGSLRKKTLCVIPKSADEIYRKSWLRGSYWPKKMDKLYPTVKGLIVPNGPFREMEAIVYKAIREISFGHDLEMVDLYNNLLSSLKNQKLLDEVEKIMHKRRAEMGTTLNAINSLNNIANIAFAINSEKVFEDSQTKNSKANKCI